MPFFYNKSKNYILANSYKVMFSTMVAQTEWEQINTRKLLGIYVSQILSPPLPKTICLVRNPYSRLVSLFEDKFRQYLFRMKEEDFKLPWQDIHTVFFDVLNVSKPTSIIKKYEYLQGMSFEDMINYLPVVYQKDIHLFPQYQSLCLGKIRLNLTPNIILKIENLEVENSWENYQLDLKIKKNVTKHQSYECYFKKDLYEIVNKIYQKDFDKFNYLQHF